MNRIDTLKEALTLISQTEKNLSDEIFKLYGRIEGAKAMLEKTQAQKLDIQNKLIEELQGGAKVAAKAKKVKACVVCGNTKKNEIEPQVLWSDGAGDDAEEEAYICKEGNGCSK